MSERGMLGSSCRKLDEAINSIMLHSPGDNIVVRPGLDIAEMAWKFSDFEAPMLILECSRSQLLHITARLAEEVSKLQSENERLKAEVEAVAYKTGIENAIKNFKKHIENLKVAELTSTLGPIGNANF